MNKRFFKDTGVSLIYLCGAVGFGIYLFLLWWRPELSWCDDCYFADLGRQLSVGSTSSHVWPVDRISYFSLFGLFFAGWYNVVGFSFFTAQLPNMILMLVCYFLIFVYLYNQGYLTNRISIVCVSLLFWFSPTLFWCANCGRKEIWTLLFAILTIRQFICVYKKSSPSWQSYGLLFLSSFFLYDSSIQGVIGVTLFVLLYSLFEFRKSVQKWISYIFLFGGYFIRFVSQIAINFFQETLHQFIKELFGNSTTFHYIYAYVYQLIKHRPMPISSTTSSAAIAQSTTFFEQIWIGLTNNLEYCVLVAVLIIVAIFLYMYGRKNADKIERTMVLMAILTPLVFVGVGRYPVYYTWIAYIPTILALGSLIEKLQIEKLVLPIISVGMLVWFFISPRAAMYRVVDFDRVVDAQNKFEIEACEIDFSKPVVIPYAWYYYLAPEYDNLYYQAGAHFPTDLDKIIVNPKDYNEESFMGCYEMEEEQRVNDKIVYKVKKRKW